MKIKAAALAVFVVLAGCGGGAEGDGPLLNSTESVCDDFAAHAKAGLPAAKRAEVVESIGEVVANADQRIRDAYPPLERTKAGTDGAYKIAADGFAQACFDAGWDG